MARIALEAGKHVICEKPLTTSAKDASTLVNLAKASGLRNCTCHNLRYYPMVQQMRAMRESGELGGILVVQGTYSQDWLLYDTDWNWRIRSADGGPSRTLADIGSHWCDMAEHVTGLRISSLCADLHTFHKTRRKPKHAVETFSGKELAPTDYETVPVDSEDFASVIFRMGDRTRGAFTASQVSAGRKNRLFLEVFGTKSSVAWNQERPDELWIGNRIFAEPHHPQRPFAHESVRPAATPISLAGTAKVTTTRSSRYSAASTRPFRMRTPRPNTRSSPTASARCTYWKPNWTAIAVTHGWRYPRFEHNAVLTGLVCSSPAAGLSPWLG